MGGYTAYAPDDVLLRTTLNGGEARERKNGTVNAANGVGTLFRRASTVALTLMVMVRGDPL